MHIIWEEEIFETMNKQETDAYFRWYVGQIPLRIFDLQQRLSADKKSDVVLDFSADS